MTDIDLNNTSAVEVGTRLLFNSLRALNATNKEVFVKVTASVGGRDYEYSLRSPSLEGDELIKTHEVQKRDF